jgi:NitT/TauT family transport system substrate-binding protein
MAQSMSRAVWLASCSAIAAGFALSARDDTSAQGIVTLKLGATPRESTAEGYYALDRGFFKKRGINLEITQLNGGAAVAAAVVGGDLQIGNSNILQLAQAFGHNVPLVILCPAGIHDALHPNTLCVVAADSPIVSPKGLNGKVVAGVSVGGLDQLCVSVLIDKSGGDSSTVKFIEMPQGEMADALAAGRIAAANLSDPELTAAGNRVRPIGDAEGSLARVTLETGWFTTRDWLASNKDAARRFAAAIFEAGNWSMANPNDAAVILERATGFHESTARQRFATTFDFNAIQVMLDAAAKYKMLGKINAEDFVWNGK